MKRAKDVVIVLLIIVLVFHINRVQNLQNEIDSYKDYIEQDTDQTISMLNQFYYDVTDTIHNHNIAGLIIVHRELKRYMLVANDKLLHYDKDKYWETDKLLDGYESVLNQNVTEYYESLLGEELSELDQSKLNEHKKIYQNLIREVKTIFEE